MVIARWDDRFSFANARFMLNKSSRVKIENKLSAHHAPDWSSTLHLVNRRDPLMFPEMCVSQNHGFAWPKQLGGVVYRDVRSKVSSKIPAVWQKPSEE